MTEPLPDFLKRIERQMSEATSNPPVGEFGNILLKIADVRRLIHEARKEKR